MKSRFLTFMTFGSAMVWGSGGCSTTRVAELPPVPLNPPGYVSVPHPEGLDIGDLMAIFTDRAAPAPDELKSCDGPYKSLRSKTQSKEELDQGAREMVKMEPVRFHWCFYGKLWDMEEQLSQMVYLDEKQKLVLERYSFLTPIARAFMSEFHDTRYLRWAVTRYRKLSEHVFYRKVELGPQSTMELAGFSNPFGLMRPPAGEIRGILEKYGITRELAAAMPQTSDAAPPMAQLPSAASDPATAPVAASPSGAIPAVEPGFNPVAEVPPATEAATDIPGITAPVKASPQRNVAEAPAEQPVQ